VPQRFVTVRYRDLQRAPDWSGVSSVEVMDQRAGEVRLRVERGTDLAAMIAAAQRNGDLVSFAYEPPTLSELFRQAVAA
jgi:ABC-2 type transport system ATP-binding protein